MSEEHAVAHAELRARVSDVVGALDAHEVELVAPATPGWRVRDVLAHMVGVSDDVVNGRLEGLTTDAWTAAQVDTRRDASVAEMLTEWGEVGPRFEAVIQKLPPPVAGQALFDAVSHEHDIRHAVGRVGARDGEALELCWEWFVAVRTSAGSPAVLFVTEYGDEISGSGELRATVRAPRFELLRASTGRRSAEEIERFEWDPVPIPDLLLAAPLFTMRRLPLGE